MSSLSSIPPRRSARLAAKYGRRVEYSQSTNEKYDGLTPQNSRHWFLLHKSPTDSDESFNVHVAIFGEYRRNMRSSESPNEKATHMLAFLKFLKDCPRFIALKPTLLDIAKQIITDFKNENIVVSDSVIAAKLQQRLDDMAYILADKKDAKIMYYGV